MAGTIVVDRIESDASYASTINVAGQITFSNTVNFGAYSGTAPVAGFYLPTTNNLAFTTASTERMRIDSSGNVGIGTNSPATKLDLVGTGDTSGTFRTTGTTNAVSLILRNGDGTTSALYSYVRFINENANNQDWRIGTYGTNNLSFVNAKAGTTPLTIDTSGNVGIGTSSPSTTNGAVTLIVGLKSANNSVLGFETTNLQYGGSLEFRRTARSGSGRFAQITGAEDISGNGLLYFYTAAAGSDVSQNMLLDGSGNLKFNSGYGSAATAYGCRAWVNFSATAGSTTIRGSGNISSITYNAVGDFTLNFSTGMPDANYAFTAYTGQAAGDERVIGAIQTQTTSALRFSTMYVSNTGGGGTTINNTNTHCTIFR